MPWHNLLTPWNRDVHKNFKDAQQVMEFPVLHELRRFFIVSRTACQMSLSSTICMQSTLPCIWCDFDRASSLICGNKMPTRCKRCFYCRSYGLLNVFRAPLCPSSGAQEYYTVVAACGISCCCFQVVGLVWSWGLCAPVCRMRSILQTGAHNSALVGQCVGRTVRW